MARNQFRGGNNHRGGGGGRGGFRGRGRGGSRNNQRDNQKPSWKTTERLNESEAGITRFMSTDEGFHGIIKSRYSDFHVNEVDLEGNNAELTSYQVPKMPKDAERDYAADLKTIITQEEFDAITKLVEADEDALNASAVEIDVTSFEKEKRTELHRLLQDVFEKKIFGETVGNETRKLVLIKKSNKNKKGRAEAWRWPHDYCYFILHKENIDTLQAISALAFYLKAKPSIFAYAGTKDKRALTSQWICAKKVEPSKICQAARNAKGIRVGNFKFLPETLSLGDLKGNRFRIALRSVKGDKNEIEKSLESFRDLGFINYYGMQRFGNCPKVPTFEVGKAFLLGDFKLAVELILKERTGEPSFMKGMRKAWADTQDPSKALEHLRATNTSVEARLLHGLKQSGPKNYINALLNIPRNMLMLYLHAYQSLMWNKIASMRRELGTEVIEGDLVYTETAKAEAEVEIIEDEVQAEEEEEASKAEEDKVAPMEEDKVVPAEEEKKEAEAKEMEVETESKYMAMVRPLTKEDLEAKTYTIFDIVLPLPGFDIKYPSNAIGDAYVELLAADGLSSEKLRNKQTIFSLPGAYRKVFVKPENFSWKFMNYEYPVDPLILSDYSKMMKDPEPADNPAGKNLALLLDFFLPSSTYATMALREIMKRDTSVMNEITLENEVKAAAGNGTTADNGNGVAADNRDTPAADKALKRPAEEVEEAENGAEAKKIKIDETEAVPEAMAE